MAMTMDELHCDLIGMLEVVCHKAVGLTASDTRVTDAKAGIDTYCKLSLVETNATNPKVPNRCEVNGSLHQSTVKTNVEHATLNPHFDQAFKLPVLSDSMCLKAFMYEQDVAGGDKFLGVATIDIIQDFLLANPPHAIKKKMFPLMADAKHSSVKPTGSVELSLAFLPNTNTVVSVTVLEAKGVSRALPHTTQSTKVKMCGWIVDEEGVKSKGSASPLKETHSVTHTGTPKWNTTIYMDHNPTHDKDIIRMKILEAEQPDCFGTCCPTMCSNPNPSMKAIGRVDLPIKELKKEQMDTELASAAKGEYGTKYITKTMDLLPATSGGTAPAGQVSLYVRYMTPEVREAVRSAKAAKLGLAPKAPEVVAAPRAAPAVPPPAPAAPAVAVEDVAVKVDEEAAKAKAAAERKAKEMADKALAQAASVKEAADKELVRMASMAASKPPPVAKAAAPAAKARAAPSVPVAKPKGRNGLFKRAVRTVMFVAGSQVVKSKLEHPRTTTAKENTMIATAAGVALSAVPKMPI